MGQQIKIGEITFFLRWSVHGIYHANHSVYVYTWYLPPPCSHDSIWYYMPCSCHCHNISKVGVYIFSKNAEYAYVTILCIPEIGFTYILHISSIFICIFCIFFLRILHIILIILYTKKGICNFAYFACIFCIWNCIFCILNCIFCIWPGLSPASDLACPHRSAGSSPSPGCSPTAVLPPLPTPFSFYPQPHSLSPILNLPSPIPPSQPLSPSLGPIPNQHTLTPPWSLQRRRPSSPRPWYPPTPSCHLIP